MTICHADQGHQEYRRQAAFYSPPGALAGLHILDLLELTGSQAKAAQALSMHQSTVSRSIRLMREQFNLQRQRDVSNCHYGGNESLHLLRLAYRAHRLMDGRLRIATDALHQPLLRDTSRLQSVPPHFRSSDEWAFLVAQALIDGAIYSSFCHERTSSKDSSCQWEGVITVPLGILPLHLISTESSSQRVMLPNYMMISLLHHAIGWHGYQLEQQPEECQEINDLLKHIRNQPSAIPLSLGLFGSDWLECQQLELLDGRPPLFEQLWLMLPEGRVHQSNEASDLIAYLRERVSRVENSRSQ